MYCKTVFTFHLAFISLQDIAEMSYYSREGGSIEGFVSWRGLGSFYHMYNAKQCYQRSPRLELSRTSKEEMAKTHGERVLKQNLRKSKDRKGWTDLVVAMCPPVD